MTVTTASTATRTVRDSFGPIDVPARHLWGAQTQRALEHFSISGERMAPELIAALAQVKRACAYVNHSLGLLSASKTTAIVAACDEVMAGAHAQEFPLQGIMPMQMHDFQGRLVFRAPGMGGDGGSQEEHLRYLMAFH